MGVEKGKTAAVLAILKSRGITVSKGARTRIESESDAATLDRWLSMVAVVETTDALFS
ncbi:MAG: hypothetical protein HY791_24725 [Deltaproteobacteria bacterium]|nr:hypothetical protein [Deltaproteobacteria bacterium]